MHLNTETIEGSDNEGDAGEHYDAKASKKEKKRQEREAARQVRFLSLLIFHAFFFLFSVRPPFYECHLKLKRFNEILNKII